MEQLEQCLQSIWRCLLLWGFNNTFSIAMSVHIIIARVINYTLDCRCLHFGGVHKAKFHCTLYAVCMYMYTAKPWTIMLLLVLVFYAWWFNYPGRILEHWFGYEVALSVTLKAGVEQLRWVWGAVAQWSVHLRLKQETWVRFPAVALGFSSPAGL